MILACLGLTFLLLWPSIAAAQTDIVEDVGQLTGEPTRVVWVQDQSPDNGDTIVTGKLLKLMGFDSRDGRGERPILNEVQNYAKPLFTPDGKQIVFSDRYRKECMDAGRHSHQITVDSAGSLMAHIEISTCIRPNRRLDGKCP